MTRSIKWFENKGMLTKTPFIHRLARKHMEKARYNLITMSFLSGASKPEAVELLNLPDDYNPSEWIVITGYYAMYMAALSVISKVGYRSKNHSATIVALDTFFVKKRLLEERYLRMLDDTRLEKEKVEQLELARERREIAPYSVTKDTTINLAEKTRKDAYEFIDRMDELLDVLEGGR